MGIILEHGSGGGRGRSGHTCMTGIHICMYVIHLYSDVYILVYLYDCLSYIYAVIDIHWHTYVYVCHI